jgi:hypothetical protein
VKPRFFRRTVQIMVENTRMRITRVLLDDHMWPPGRGLRQHVRDIVVLDPNVAKVVWDRIDAQ